VDGPQSRYHPVGTGTHRCHRLAARTAVAEEIPARTLLAYVGRASPLVLAVIPLLQIGVAFGLAAAARQRTCLQLPRQRTGQHPGEPRLCEPLGQAPGLVLTARSEREVGPAGVLTSERPCGLAVPRQIHLGKYYHRDASVVVMAHALPSWAFAAATTRS